MEEEIFIANEWISPVQGWSEGSLVMAENMLHHYFALAKPHWIREDKYTSFIFDKDSLTNFALLDDAQLSDITNGNQVSCPTLFRLPLSRHLSADL